MSGPAGPGHSDRHRAGTCGDREYRGGIDGGQQNEEAMKCVICKHGNTEPGYATVTLERGGTVLVIRDVPAQICSECGEYYLDTATSTHVMALGEEAVQRHAEVEVLRYVA